MTTQTKPTRAAAADGGQDKILAALAALGQATATQVADHAGLGYSTVTARLRKLADAGTVHKQPSGTGPTSWRPAVPTTNHDNQPEPAIAPEQAEPDQAEPTASKPEEPEPEAPEEAEPDGPEEAEPTEGETGSARDSAPSAVDTTGDHAGGGEAAERPTTAPTSPAKPATSAPGTRRPPGKLREQVLGVLQDHAEQTFTPHQISKLLDGASSGAIVLACRKLVGQGSVKQTRERPATFQAE